MVFAAEGGVRIDQVENIIDRAANQNGGDHNFDSSDLYLEVEETAEQGQNTGEHSGDYDEQILKVGGEEGQHQ